ncbi:DUF4386 domain-containing protein [Flagellimonas sp. HMM57]|uniref:DUF4386 domain-containing protein n=1 Tax=unclassified Flagellimonas TaxID=2644544 RepID=UPI0013D67F3D|nr:MULTISPECIES: DUF4386 domain-containing protein [unclassified Flagellimonas]UII74458.1 DUF4386 domain-containing protein [Flagellimonas sp. HMM57]
MNTYNGKELSLSKAALFAGISLLVMVLTTPFAEFSIFSKLIDYDSPTITAENIINNKYLFSTAIFLILLTLIADITASWALYILLKPVNKSLSLLTAWFRLIYTAMYFIAMYNLLSILSVVNSLEHIKHMGIEQINERIFLYFKAFRVEGSFGLIFFGIYLIFLGYLVYKATYIPKAFGIILIVAGLSWIIDNLSVFFFPNLDTQFLFILTIGELVFMLWLLIKGSRLKNLE